MPEVADQSQLEQQNQKILDAISKADVRAEDIDQISAELSTPEKLQAIRETTKEALRKAWESLSKRNGPLTPREQKIVELYNRLFSGELIQKKIEETNKPSGNLSSIIKEDGTVNTDALKNLSPDQIKEKIGKLNKADLKLVLTSLDALEGGALRQVIMQIVTPFIETMVQNGYTLENSSDVDFLLKNAGEKTQKALNDWKATVGTNPFDGNKKYIIKGEKILALTNEKGELTAAGIDISKINTVDPKTGAEQLRKQLPASFDKEKFSQLIQNFLKSENRLFKGIGEILKIFGALLGIDFGEKKEGITETLGPKQKRELLAKMEKPNDAYDIASFFDTKGDLIGKNEDPKFQLYLRDIDKILGPGVVKKSADGKSLIFDEGLSKAILDFQKAVKMEGPTGKLDRVSIGAILKNLGPDGNLIQKTETASAVPLAAPPAAPEKAPEAPKKHELADLFLSMKDRPTKELLFDQELLAKIQSQIGDVDAVKRFQIGLGMKSNDLSKKKRPDGRIGEETVKAYFKKYEGGYLKVDAPKK